MAETAVLRKIKTAVALLLLAIASVGAADTSRVLAGEVQVTSGDATARFIALGVSKAIVIDLPTDIQDVLVADKGVANIVVQSKRRVYILGVALGQTNIFLFDAQGRQIDALDIAVTATTQQSELENSPFPANVVQIYRAAKVQTINCTPIICVDATKPGSDQAPGTQNINITGSPTATYVGVGK
jgi:Flp pilus assembly secretin CpaC